MILLVDRQAAQAARLVGEDRSKDVRRYYLLDTPKGDAIIVCRHGLVLPDLAGEKIDCSLGWDVAVPGLATEDQVGQQRSKITIYRTVRMTRAGRTLSKALKRGVSHAPDPI